LFQHPIGRINVSTHKGGEDTTLTADTILNKINNVYMNGIKRCYNEHLKKDPELDLREVEYAACNGILRTLDPHSVFLSPDAYKEMNISTSGHFGGLGIVISIRDQQLTVMRPMPDTPAGRAGLKRYDRIMKINNESTLNMPLDDAVNRLRGKAGSHVTVWVHRDGSEGWTGSRPAICATSAPSISAACNPSSDSPLGIAC